MPSVARIIIPVILCKFQAATDSSDRRQVELRLPARLENADFLLFGGLRISKLIGVVRGGAIDGGLVCIGSYAPDLGTGLVKKEVIKHKVIEIRGKCRPFRGNTG